MSGNVHEAILVEQREVAAAIDELVFEVVPGGAPGGADDQFRWRPGQFVSIRVGQEPGGALILRSYSIAGGSGARFSLIIKRIDGGIAARFFAELGLGGRIRLTGPMGFFVLELAHASDVVFGATGVGIAPVRPMLEEALARNERGRVFLLWGSRRRDELFWQREIAELAANPRLSVRTFLSGAGEAAPPYEAGRITAPLLALAPTLEKPTFYLVGSGAMIREIKTALVASGVDRKRQIRNEAFFD